MRADLFLNPNEKESISSCFNNELNNGFIYFMLECTRNNYGLEKIKICSLCLLIKKGYLMT